jgi:hypothetical protein
VDRMARARVKQAKVGECACCGEVHGPGVVLGWFRVGLG